MRRAVEELKRSTKDVESKLDMLEWKVETLSQNNYTSRPVHGSTSKECVDISQFLKDISNVKKEYVTIKQDLKAIIDLQKESMDQLHDRMDNINEKFTRITELIGEQ